MRRHYPHPDEAYSINQAESSIKEEPTTLLDRDFGI